MLALLTYVLMLIPLAAAAALIYFYVKKAEDAKKAGSKTLTRAS